MKDEAIRRQIASAERMKQALTEHVEGWPSEAGPTVATDDGTMKEQRLAEHRAKLKAAITTGQPPLIVTPGTAFVLMWMDTSHPELQDVVETLRETFYEFGIDAKRADDIEHQDVITNLILERIRTAEFLVADLSGERPNVYYEVGFAHAIGKRPILYRRKGTQLHFDLSVHNVPEYQNVTELRRLVRKRLEVIVGRRPLVG